MGIVVCSFELSGVTLSEATQRMNAIKTQLDAITPGAGEDVSIKSIEYRADATDLD